MKLAEEMQAHTAQLEAGRCVDYADYKNVCGVLRGLTLARGLLNDLATSLDHSDE
jgi:hypothetical protein